MSVSFSGKMTGIPLGIVSGQAGDDTRGKNTATEA
jgi:hypothetical protein